ncbi:SET domain-containing protein [candidate division KSB1 bacterium]|nr:SET domain-containing protein [candidate division KSB1 bacterium]NIS23058.1 SET domain-containing protein [candidate division KSB1 bacterium]NIT70123.1 SET domain-containing protein [candidate division KSB1 bacterium]NIU93167.1 SET domain-containing protein-lysine N-methyltransferase [candidate division KSB1 bacterium]NIW68207.1 SET domain-containing protein-lysine N-methyltransferase [candidate division KSB1 bacterium]
MTQHISTSPFALSVKRSRAGLGLYANEPIPKNSFVIEYFGKILSNEEADRRGGKYLFDISSRRTVDGSTWKNLARYINHSCRPNCEVEVKRGRIYIYAKRAIEPGEELGYDYGKEYVDEFIKPRGCRCNHCAVGSNASLVPAKNKRKARTKTKRHK